MKTENRNYIYKLISFPFQIKYNNNWVFMSSLQSVQTIKWVVPCLHQSAFGNVPKQDTEPQSSWCMLCVRMWVAVKKYLKCSACVKSEWIVRVEKCYINTSLPMSCPHSWHSHIQHCTNVLSCHSFHHISLRKWKISPAVYRMLICLYMFPLWNVCKHSIRGKNRVCTILMSLKVNI